MSLRHAETSISNISGIKTFCRMSQYLVGIYGILVTVIFPKIVTRIVILPEFRLFRNVPIVLDVLVKAITVTGMTGNTGIPMITGATF